LDLIACAISNIPNPTSVQRKAHATRLEKLLNRRHAWQKQWNRLFPRLGKQAAIFSRAAEEEWKRRKRGDLAPRNGGR
jgi:hypothetical protein